MTAEKDFFRLTAWRWVGLIGLLLIGAAAAEEPLNRGQQLFHAGAYEEAIQTWEAALPETTPAARTDILIRLVAAYQAIGDYPAAHATGGQAIQLAESVGSETRKILAYSQVGDLFLALQQPDSAYRYLADAVELARGARKPALLAHALNNLGNLFALDEAYHPALDAYREVAALATAAGNLYLQGQALSNQVRIHLRQNRPAAARTALTQAQALIKRLPQAYRQGMLAIGLGELYLRLFRESVPQTAADLHQAADLFAQAEQFGRTADDTGLRAYAAGYLAQTYLAAGRHVEALHLSQRAVFLAQSRPALLYRWEWWQGRILDAMGNGAEALAAYQRAYKYLAPIRPTLLIGRDAQRSFAERVRPVYYDYAGGLLQQARNLPAGADKTALQEQAVDILEALKIAELQDYFQDECVTEARKVRLDTLDPHTAVLYPVLLRNRIELLLSIGGRFTQYTVPVPARQINQTLKQFQHNLQVRTRWTFINQAKQLYNWLIEPAREQLLAANIHTLVLVPDGALRMIPPAALYGGEQYLTEAFAVVVTPGLSLTEPHALPKDNIQILLNGLSEGVQDFSPLPSVPAEIDTIASLFETKNVLMNQNFLLENVNKSLQTTPYHIVHLATHGEFDRDPGRTFLLTYDDKLTLNRLETLLRFDPARREAVELLTMSACQTAVGDERAALGLAGVAIKAGARSAVASLWFVNDESTTMLMQEFYTQLRQPGISKAEALSQAQRKLLAHKVFRHPAYWSPFLLIGNWL